MQVVAAALRSLGPLRDEALDQERGAIRRRLREAIAATDLAAATGRVRFDEHGDRKLGVALYAVEEAPEGPRARVRGWLGER